MRGPDQFTGSEFDWLRARVEAVLWRRSAPAVQSPNHQPRLLASTLETLPYEIRTVEATQPKLLFQQYALMERQQRREASFNSIAALGGVGASRSLRAGLSVRDYNELRAASSQLSAALPYVYQEYPCVLYREGQTRVIDTAGAHEEALREGWHDTPGG